VTRKTGGRTLDTLLALLDEAFDKRSWHGTNLRGSIRGTSAAAAAWRPDPQRHNVWELVVHAAYWKYAVRRRLTGEKRGSFALQGSNWFKRPTGSATERDLAADIRLLVREHELLREVVAGMSDRDLARPAGQWTKGALIRGAASHDLYHAGQIQILKRLRKQKRG
jgi:hypothetical protein